MDESRNIATLPVRLGKSRRRAAADFDSIEPSMEGHTSRYDILHQAELPTRDRFEVGANIRESLYADQA